MTSSHIYGILISMSHRNATRGAKAAERQARLAALKDGRVQRSHTFTDRRKAADKRAAKGRSYRGDS